MTLSDSAFPSSAAFDVLAKGMEDPALKQKYIKQANVLVQFDIKNKEGKTASWYLDAKNKGEVGKGKAPSKADITLIIGDADMHSLFEGKANPQKLFMSGKLKVKGNVMKAAALEPVLKAARTEAKL